MSNYPVTFSWSVEGFGDPATGLPYRLRVAHKGNVSSGVVAGAIISSWPSTIETEIDFTRGSLVSSSYNITVQGIDRDPIGIALRRWVYQSNPLEIGYLDADLTAVATTLTFRVALGQSAPANNTNIYLEREVMRVTNVTGAGPTYTLTVERGKYGSLAVAHDSHPAGDIAIYDANTIVVGRRVTVYDYDHRNDTESPVWAGILEKPDLGDGTLSMMLPARDSWAHAQDTRLGQGRFQGKGKIVTSEAAGLASGGSFIYQFGGEGHVVDPPLLLPQGNKIAIWEGETIVGAEVVAQRERQSPAGNPESVVVISEGGSGFDAYQPLFGTPAGEEGLAKPGTMREVLVADSESDLSMVRDDAGALSDHPVDILLNIMMSTGTATWPDGGGHSVGTNGNYDWLPKHWGLAIPASLIHTAGFEAFRTTYPYAGLRAQNFVLGAEKKLSKAPAVLRRILAPILAFPGFTSEYLLTLVRLVDPGPGNVDATITEANLQRDARQVAIQAQPWSKFPRFNSLLVEAARQGVSSEFGARVLDAEVHARAQNRNPQGKVLEIDGGDYGDPVTHSLDEDLRAVLADLNARRLRVLRDRLPEYDLPLRAGVTNLPAGSTIELTVNVLVGPDGDRKTVSGHRCLVIASQRDPASRVQNIRVLDLYPLTRSDKLVAPSWRITAVTSDQVFDVEQTAFTSNDWTTWKDNASVELYSAAGANRSTDGPQSGTINLGTGRVTLSGSWRASSVAVTPVVGDIVRIPDYDAAQTDWSAYAFIGDTNAQLGAGNDAPHRWSF